MIRLQPDGTYRRPGGPDPKKSKAKREQELLGMMGTADGTEIIRYLWKEATGSLLGVTLPGEIGTLTRQEKIPAILAHEYPN
jgi:hypothetical protein